MTAPVLSRDESAADPRACAGAAVHQVGRAVPSAPAAVSLFGVPVWIRRLELGLFLGLLAALNAGLIFGQVNAGALFYPEAVLDGQWSRLILHSWVHVSGYHLLLDGSAFLSLFWMGGHRRWIHLAGAWIGSWAALWLFDPLVADIGYCGLSGIGHGLFAAVCLSWMQIPTGRIVGALLLTGVCLKSVVEVLTGGVLLGAFHPGSIGTPLPWSHLGGVIGAVVGYPAASLIYRAGIGKGRTVLT